MKIVDFKCTQLGPYPVLRLVTDVGIDGFAQAEVSTTHAVDSQPQLGRVCPARRLCCRGLHPPAERAHVHHPAALVLLSSTRATSRAR